MLEHARTYAIAVKAFLASYDAAQQQSDMQSPGSQSELYDLVQQACKVTSCVSAPQYMHECRQAFGLRWTWSLMEGVGLTDPRILVAAVLALTLQGGKWPKIGRKLVETFKSFQQAAREFSEELRKGQEPLVSSPAASCPLPATLSGFAACDLCTTTPKRLRIINGAPPRERRCHRLHRPMHGYQCFTALQEADDFEDNARDILHQAS
jgi:hypothetical protein